MKISQCIYNFGLYFDQHQRDAVVGHWHVYSYYNDRKVAKVEGYWRKVIL